ncbi:hypothetical protein ACMHYB_44855 [Sorangium sp. So ce1128]
MAMIWAFVKALARRSKIIGWIRGCTTVRDCHLALRRGRAMLAEGPREAENLPWQEEMVGY